ncbi:MAG: transketolase [Christensenellaceae bacterium]|nr:transketolase [Eubacteriales bacterium]MEA5069436.1 transketolase [Christensenellaceae bacterium]
MLTADTRRALLNFSLDIREQILRQLAKRGFGHLGGCMSVADIVSVLYGLDMRIDPRNPQWEGRDLLVCSKGHAGPAIYAALALKGYFPMEWMDTLNQPGTNLPSHCDRLKTPGIDMTTGSLGQGISVAAGMALGLKYDESDRRVYCFIGDGESQEGQVWEALLFAAQHKLDNLIVFLDYNHMQLDGPTAEIGDLGDIARKFTDFGWYTQEIDGHDPDAIHAAILAAKASSGRPCAIVANTVKGKDCCFAEGKLNHHVTVSPEQAQEGFAHMDALRRALNK